jgi:hypothetical protein
LVLAPLLVAASLLPAQACAGSDTLRSTPETTVLEFSRALNQARFDDAYALMSPDYRRRVSLDAFRRQVKENPQETAEVSRALGTARGEAREEATLRYGDDAELRLERRDGRWFLATDVVDYYDQASPRAALRSFVRAMERERYDVVMRLVPEADKEGVTTDRLREAWTGEARADVQRMLHNLRANMEAPIEVVGDHATMPYGDRFRVQFLREGDVWKIEDPE